MSGNVDSWDPAQRWRGLAVVCAAMVVSAIDMTIVNVALPEISRDLEASLGELQWVLDAFLVALAGFLAVAGGVADRFGRRRTFLAGMTGFGVASLLAALAPSIETLVAARALMGATAAFVLPPALSLLTVMFDPGERPRALGVWTMAAGVAMALGPLLGGALVATIGWPGVFLVNLPVLTAAVPAGLRLLPESLRPGTPPLDLGGAVLSVVALTGIVYVLVEGDRDGWASAGILAALVAGVLASIGFVARELRIRDPLLDVRILLRRRVAGGTVAVLALYASFLGVMFVVPQYLQYVQERSAFLSGLAMFPVGIGVGLAPLLSRRPPLTRLAPGTAIPAGLAVAALGCGVLLPFSDDTPFALVAAGMLLYGTAFGFAIIPATATIMNDLPVAKAGDGSATNQLARQIGGALGVAVVGSLSAAIYAGNIRDRLPPTTRGDAESSIGHAERVAAHLPAGLGSRVIEAADASFDAGARAGLSVAAGALLLAAIFARAMMATRRSVRAPAAPERLLDPVSGGPPDSVTD